jgi:hypothetical protein
MKRATLAFLVLICFSGLQAQYKKASFFEKQGRTYGINLESHFLGDGKGTVPGLSISFGRDQSGKRLFSSTDIRVLPSFKFSYESQDDNANPITVSGKSKLHLIYAMNWGFYLRNNEDEEQKFKPYITAGFNVVILGGVKELINDDSYNYDDSYYYAVKKTSEQQFSSGLGGGLGAIFNLNSVLGLKLEGGYIYQFNISSEYVSGEDVYYMYTPHPYASLGLRFRVESK